VHIVDERSREGLAIKATKATANGRIIAFIRAFLGNRIVHQEIKMRNQHLAPGGTRQCDQNRRDIEGDIAT
jgi:hypothetical protein